MYLLQFKLCVAPETFLSALTVKNVVKKNSGTVNQWKKGTFP